MEKFLKVILRISIVILVIILIAILCIFGKNLIIFGTIRLKGNKIMKSDNCHVTITSSMPDYDYSVRKEIYTKDNLQTIYVYNHDELNEINWRDLSSGESLAYVATTQGNYDIDYNVEIINELESLIKLKEFSLFKNCVSNILETKDGCYVFKAGKNYEIYYDQFSGELVKTVTYNNDLETINIVHEYKFELDKVEDENVKKPIIEK